MFTCLENPVSFEWKSEYLVNLKAIFPHYHSDSPEMISTHASQRSGLWDRDTGKQGQKSEERVCDVKVLRRFKGFTGKYSKMFTVENIRT